MYGDPSCPKCQQAKTYFEDNGINYTFKNVIEDAQAREKLFHLSDTQGVPTFQIGQEVIVGFDQEKLEAVLH